ncbi:hypothetical protein PG995_014677 [Apiospora arundinis]|uniref:Uncharacterized protein n=1 Tax=Apiospora arundinis TaxID=335852 RepID=A0ABR2II26_9PEZI
MFYSCNTELPAKSLGLFPEARGLLTLPLDFDINQHRPVPPPQPHPPTPHPGPGPNGRTIASAD